MADAAAHLRPAAGETLFLTYEIAVCLRSGYYPPISL
jgi:hypothetical protein